MSRSSRILLGGAGVAAPLFLVSWAAQAFTRVSFRPTFHPMSLLSLGEMGWVQIANFIITGLLVIGGSVGLRRTLEDGRLTRWVTALIATMGIGLVLAGLFPTDAGAGFPAGAPAGAPVMTWHGAVHETGFLVTQLAFIVAGILLAIRFGRSRQRGWMLTCVAAVVSAVLIAALGAPETLAIRLVISSAIELGLISTLAIGSLMQRLR